MRLRNLLPLCGVLCFLMSCGGGSNNGTQPSPPPAQNLKPSISVVPTGLDLLRGQSGAVKLTVANDSGSEVQLAFSGVPAGVTATLGATRLTAGAETSLGLEVADDAPTITSATVQVTATRSGNTGTASFTLSLPEPGAIGLSLPAIVHGTDASQALAYDSKHKLLFSANPKKNSVDVISIAEARVIKTIPVPNPAALDMSPGNSRLYIGSNVDTGTIAIVDTDRLEIVRRVPGPDEVPVPPNHLWSLVCASNGHVLLQYVTSNLNAVVIFSFDPASESYKDITPTQATEPGNLVRSANHATVGWFSGYFHDYFGTIYDASADEFGSVVPFPLLKYAHPLWNVAIHPSGSPIAMLEADGTDTRALVIRDRDLSELTRVPDWTLGGTSSHTPETVASSSLGLTATPRPWKPSMLPPWPTLERSGIGPRISAIMPVPRWRPMKVQRSLPGEKLSDVDPRGAVVFLGTADPERYRPRRSGHR